MLTFGAAGFLFGLLALAAPVIAHLMQREMALPVRFPSIRFITLARQPREERRRLRDLLLLAMRLLLLAAIVFALAQPQWEPRAAAAAPADGHETIILVDTSASIGGWDGLAEAREALRDVLAERGDRRVGLVLFAHRVLEQLEPGAAPADVRRIVDEAQAVPARGRPGEALREAFVLFGGEGERELVVISDFNESTWLTELPAVPDGIDVTPVTVGTAGRAEGNAGILEARVFPYGDEGSRTVLRVRNYGDEAVTLPVEIESAGRRLRREVTLDPGQTRPVTFETQHRERAPAVARLPDDPYPGDNEHHFWTGRPPALRVLAFLPQMEEPERADDYFFTRLALEANVEGDWVNFEPASSSRAFFSAEVLAEARAVYLPGTLAYLDRGQLDALRAWVEEGGVVLATPGRSPLRMFRALANAGLGNHRFDQMTAPPGAAREIDHPGWINPESRFSRIFDEGARRDLFGVNLLRYARFEADSEATVILRSESDNPLLTQQSVGRGSVYVAAFSFGPDFTDIRVRPTFVPLVREIFSEAATGEGGVLELETGAAPPASLARRGVTGERLARPGLIEADGIHASVNIPPAEGSLRQVDPVRRLAQADTVAYRGPRTAGAIREAAEGTVDLWPWMILLAALAFAAETLLAGRRGEAATQNDE
ncbi:MAG: BatA domain-containing protein [Opitutales bacterium]|nr:BatA domain-containing protein [Opitutales bacterium]